MRSFNSRSWVGALLSVVVLAVGGEAFAATIWSTQDDGERVGTIDSITGASTDRGNTGQTGAFAAAFDVDGTLYTIFNGFSNLPATSVGAVKLATVDQNTGIASAVGSRGTPLIAIDFDASGQLWGVGFTDQILYQIDKTTGATTGIGITGVVSHDLAFDSSGTLYSVDNNTLHSLNLTTAEETLVTTFTGILAGEVMGIMFDSSDTLFATTHVTNSPLYTLDVVTGVASIVGTTMFHKPHGGDIYVIPAPVPEPSTLLLVALGLVGGIRYFPRARSA